MNKLSVKEKHIYVTQGLQRQGANKKDKQYSEAIDIALIKAESRIIKDRLFPDKNVPYKFEINEKYVSDIQSIIIRNQELVTFKNILESYGVLPYDFSYLLSDTSNIIEDCKEEFTTPTPTELKTERIIIIPFTSSKVSAPYYTKIICKVLATVSDTLNFTGYSTLEEKTYIINNIIRTFKDLGKIVYWEEYKDIYKSGCFLLPTLDLGVTASISVDDGAYVTTTNIDKQVTTYKSSLSTINIQLNRDIKADFLDSAQSSFYNQSIPISPLSTIANNQILIRNTERFLANKIFISYIRTPRKISLALNQNSELSGTVHEEICDLAIQILKKQIEDESYSKEVLDNKGRIENRN